MIVTIQVEYLINGQKVVAYNWFASYLATKVSQVPGRLKKLKRKEPKEMYTKDKEGHAKNKEI